MSIDLMRKTVLIDAKWYFRGPVSGNVFMKNLIKSLLINDVNDYILIVDKRDYQLAKTVFDGKAEVIGVPVLTNAFTNVFLVPFLLKGKKYDWYIAQNFCPVISFGTKVALYVHDLLFLDYPEFYTKKERFYFASITRMARRADMIYAPSATEIRRIKKYVRGQQVYRHVYHGVDDRYDPNYEENFQGIGIELPDKYILFVGRLNDRKNVMSLLEAHVGMDIPLVVVGERDWKSSHDLLQYSERVVFTGALYGSSLRNIFKNASVFCFPSLAESFGLPLVEAMKAGLPIVTANNTCIPEIVGDAAYCVDVENPSEIRKALVRSIYDCEFAKGLRDKGIERAKRYTWGNCAEEIQNSLW